MEILYTSEPRPENGQPSFVCTGSHALQDPCDRYTWQMLADENAWEVLPFLFPK